MEWSSVGTVLQILFYVILFVILLYIIYVFYWTSRNNSELVLDDDDDDEIPLPTTNHRGSGRTEFNLIQGRIFLDAAREDHSVKPINFVTFKHLVESNPQFMRDYYKGIKLGFQLKLERYKVYLRKLYDEIKSYETSNSSYSSHDTSYERNRYCANELEDVVKTLRKRIQNLSMNQTRQHLLLAINDPDNGLISLVGREDVKNKIVRTLYSYCRSPSNFLSSHNGYCVVGDAGVGKTKLCEAMAFIFQHSGILARGKTTKITKTDITSQYVAESESLTRKQLFRSFESILHLEEIYDLVPGKMADKMGMAGHGKNSLNEIIFHIDHYIGLSIVLISGYKDEMEDQLFASNQGLRRRFPNYIELKGYSSGQLTKILIEFLHKKNPQLVLNQIEEDYLFTLVASIYENRPDIFKAQAGAMVNLATDIVDCMNSSIEYQWCNNPHTMSHGNQQLLMNGINQYLKNYGLGISTTPHNVEAGHNSDVAA